MEKKTFTSLTIMSLFMCDIACCMDDVESLAENASAGGSAKGVVRSLPVVIPSADDPWSSFSVNDAAGEARGSQSLPHTGAVVATGLVALLQSPRSPLLPTPLQPSEGVGDVGMKTLRRDQLPGEGEQLIKESAGGTPIGGLRQPFLPPEPSQALSRFLETMGWTKEDLSHSQHVLTLETLQRIAHVELIFCPPRWTSFDHFFEKIFYGPFLNKEGISHSDIEGFKTKCCNRFWINGRAIPLKSTKTLKCAVAINSLREGIEDGILDSLHLSLFSLLMYQLTQSTAVNLIDTFRQADHTSVLGIANLMHRQPAVFAFLAAPLALGIAKALRNVCSVDDRPDIRMKQAKESIESYPEGLWTDYFRPLLPLPPLDQYLSTLQRIILWEGRASPEDREKAFQAILTLANNRKGYSQLTAMHSLARIVHGLHLKDFDKLRHVYKTGELNGQRAYEDNTLRHFLSMKTRALETLERLSHQRATICERVNVLYAGYLLWTLGLNPLTRDSVVMGIFKYGKTALHGIFFKLLIQTIIEYINCPDKGGFSWAGGYQPWSNSYTVQCFDELVREFNLITGQPISTLTDQIGAYYFPDGTYALDLSNKGLDGDAVLEITQGFIRNGITLIALNLAGNNVNKAHFFRALIPLIPSVKEFTLSMNGIEEPSADSTSQDTIALGESLGNFTGLELFDISRNYIGYNDIEGILSLAQGLQRIPSLTNLNLMGNWLGYRGAAGSAALGNALQSLSSLTFLDLSDNAIGWENSQDTSCIGTAFQNLSSLISLDLSYNHLGWTDSQGMIAIGNNLEYLKSLTFLDLSRNFLGYTDPNGVISLPTGLRMLKYLSSFNINSQFPFLNSTYTTLLNQALSYTAVKIPLQMSLYTSQDVDSYFASLPLNITTLNLAARIGSTPLGNSQTIKAIMAKLKNYPSLAFLDLSNNYIGYIDPQETVELGNGLQSLSSLISLDLSDNSIGFNDFQGTWALGKGLESLSQLMHLNLSYNALGWNDSNGVVAIGNALQYLRFLQSLDLSLNWIGLISSDGVVALGNGLRNCTSLTSLNLYYNRIGFTNSQGTVALANGLRHLSSLTLLDLDHNWVGYTNSKGTVAIADVLDDLISLKTLRLSWNYVGSTDSTGMSTLVGALPKLSQLQTVSLSGAQNISWTEGAQILDSLRGEALRDSCESEICFSTPIHPSNDPNQKQLALISGHNTAIFSESLHAGDETSVRHFERLPHLLPDHVPEHTVTIMESPAFVIPPQTSSASHRAQPLGQGMWKFMAQAVDYTRSWFSLDAWVNSATRAAFNLATERNEAGQLVNAMPATFPNLLNPLVYDWATPIDEPEKPSEQTVVFDRSQPLLNFSVLRSPCFVVPEPQYLTISK